MFNLLTIFIVGIVYFVTKELYRIRGENMGRVGVAIVGSLIGVIITLIYLFMSMSVVYSPGSLPILSDAHKVYNEVYLTPSIIIALMFVLMIDRRLVFPLFIFQGLALFIRMVQLDGNLMDANSFLWTRILFDSIEYVLLVVLLFFIPSVKIIKNNGIKILIAVLIMIFVCTILDIIYYASVSSMLPTWFTSENGASLISIEYGYLFIYATLQGGIVILVEKVYSNFNALETFSTQDDISYYKMSLAQNSLIRMIDEEKVNIGLLVLFQIKANKEGDESGILEKIRIYTEDKYKNTFYFKASANYYGAFFQFEDDFKLDETLRNNRSEERTEEDELYALTTELLRIEKEEDASIIASGSIYGIHSYSISELVEQARFLMSPTVRRANQNIVVVYDYKRVKQRLNETTQVRNLPVDTEKIRISYLRALSSKITYYPSITFKDEELELSDMIENGDLGSEQINILLRHSAYQTMRKFNQEKGNLVVYYSTMYLNSPDFSLKDFKKKVERHIEMDKLIIGLSTTQGEMGSAFSKNINALREDGVRFAIINPRTTKQKEHDLIMPEFILDPATEANPLKIREIKLEFETNAILLNPNLVN